MTDQPTTRHPLTDQQLDEIHGRAAALHEYATLTDDPWQAEADQLTGTDVPALLAEIRRLRDESERRTLTPGEYDAAWHAIEGAAGEDGADPGTILAAVLDRLGIAATEPSYVRAARDGFGDDEITDILNRPRPA